MSKKRKSGNKVKPDSLVNLIAAIANLIVALILLYEKLKS